MDQRNRKESPEINPHTFPGSSDGKESAYNVEELDSMIRQENPLQKEMEAHSSTLPWKNPIDRGVWWATVHGVAKSQTY